MTPIASPVMILAAGFVLVLAGSSLFSHALETTVERFFENRNRGLRILGNLSLSLPELMLPLIAFLTPGRTPSRIDAGTGALFGPPLFLCLFLIPLSFLLRPPQARILTRETPLLVAGLIGALALLGDSFLERFALSAVLGVLYLWGLLTTPAHEEELLSAEGRSSWGIKDGLSLGGGALLMGVGSHLFLSGIERLQELYALSPFWVALTLAPIATEAPELLTMTHFLRKRSIPQSFSILWGSIHLQATLGVASGLLASPWQESRETLHAGEALLSALALVLAVGTFKRFGGDRMRP